MQKQIRSALLSVYHKDGLEPIIESLHRLGIRMYATGGTYDFIREMKLPVTAVEELTGYPSILGGRVKTLHPAIFGGILSRRDDHEHQQEMEKHGLPHIDLVVVDLYPFRETVQAGGTDAAIIEKIDIGGISLIRAAAKNFHDVLIIPSVADYGFLNDVLERKDGMTGLEERRDQATKAFAISSAYDGAIAGWFSGKNVEEDIRFTGIAERRTLRYGENPHQQACYHGDLDKVFTQLSGKELSYNNLLDIDAALGLTAAFDQPTFSIIKHNNACGTASDQRLSAAWEKALAGDPVSAFGGVIACNRPLDAEVASSINQLFFEVLAAPGFSSEALHLLTAKKNRILLETKNFDWPARHYRSILNGILEQGPDSKTEDESHLRVVTVKSPTPDEIRDLLFANKLVKHSKSNAIILARGQQLLGSGVGQTSRVDALKQAIEKARHFGFDLNGAVMASDAFFPFPDCVELAAAAGITAVIQPGGSIRDEDSVTAANTAGIAMVVTGIRHFRH